VAERPVLGDSAISEIEFRGDVGIVIGRLNAFEIAEPGEGDCGEDAPRRGRSEPEFRHDLQQGAVCRLLGAQP